MAENDAPREAGRPPRKGAVKPLNLTIPEPLHDYLCHLARHSMLGTTEQEVAVHILTRELNAMFTVRYHESNVPKV